MGGESLEDMVKLISFKEGGNQMISYYDLLGMIKEGNIPEKVKYDDNTYVWNDRNYFETELHTYLSNDIDEVDMFNKGVEIIEDKKIEKLNTKDGPYTSLQLDIIDKINEIIEVLNEK